MSAHRHLFLDTFSILVVSQENKKTRKQEKKKRRKEEKKKRRKEEIRKEEKKTTTYFLVFLFSCVSWCLITAVARSQPSTTPRVILICHEVELHLLLFLLLVLLVVIVSQVCIVFGPKAKEL